MGWNEIAVGLLVVGAVIVALGGWGCARRRIFSGVSAALAGLVIAMSGVVVGLIGANLLIYSRLTYEQPVAEISVRAVDLAEKRYAVMVQPLGQPSAATSCALQGDDWLLSARVQRWKPWANIIGLDSTYRLEQIANRYRSAAEGTGKPITACDIDTPPLPPITGYIPAQWQAWLLSQLRMEDRRFGSANYMPLAHGAVYRVVMTQAGLNAEPANDVARAASAQN